MLSMAEFKRELSGLEHDFVLPLVQQVAHELSDTGRISHNFDDIKLVHILAHDPTVDRLTANNVDGTYVVTALGYPEVEEFMRLVHDAGIKYARAYDSSNWRDVNDVAARCDADEATRKFLRRQLDPKSS